MLASTAGSAGAQQDVLPDTGGRVYGLIGGGFGDSKFVATGAGAGLRLTPHLGLDLELTHLSGSDRNRRGCGHGFVPWHFGVQHHERDRWVPSEVQRDSTAGLSPVPSIVGV
ncbi:MAG: hypothetical protein OXG04_08665 [Acidobacteria bacterium]|nr:hypothetical protein [Acidobacteriota bacterium]